MLLVLNCLFLKLTDLPLDSQSGNQKGKTLIMSPLASLSEIEEAVTTARKAGCVDLILFKDALHLSRQSQQSNLLTIPIIWPKSFLPCQVVLFRIIPQVLACPSLL